MHSYKIKERISELQHPRHHYASTIDNIRAADVFRRYYRKNNKNNVDKLDTYPVYYLLHRYFDTPAIESYTIANGVKLINDFFINKDRPTFCGYETENYMYTISIDNTITTLGEIDTLRILTHCPKLFSKMLNYISSLKNPILMFSIFYRIYIPIRWGDSMMEMQQNINVRFTPTYGNLIKANAHQLSRFAYFHNYFTEAGAIVNNHVVPNNIISACEEAIKILLHAITSQVHVETIPNMVKIVPNEREKIIKAKEAHDNDYDYYISNYTRIYNDLGKLLVKVGIFNSFSNYNAHFEGLVSNQLELIEKLNPPIHHYY